MSALCHFPLSAKTVALLFLSPRRPHLAASTQSPIRNHSSSTLCLFPPPVLILTRGLPYRRATLSSSENADTSAAESLLPPSGDQKSLPSRPICLFLLVRPTLLGALCFIMIGFYSSCTTLSEFHCAGIRSMGCGCKQGSWSTR